jgi:histidinol-phosphatase (PHP family)
MEEMVLAAIENGFAYLGFSEHGYTDYDGACCIKRENIPAYFAEANRLKEAYPGQSDRYVGFENDDYQRSPKQEQDFTIGSVHYLRDGSGDYQNIFTIDYTHSQFEGAIEKTAGGDIRLLVANYYSMMADMAESYRPDIIGHLDLIIKLNADGRYFDESSGWYRKIVAQACERIAATGCIVELNTGGIRRGYRTEPYPARWTLELLRDLNVPVTISSDTHSADSLDFWFDQAESLLRDCGFKSVRQLERGKWVDIEL